MSESAKKKSRQRLGGAGGGLTLPAFVNAKSNPRFNPADFRKKCKQFENAKKIKKYKKLVKCLPLEEVRAGSIEELSGTEGKMPASNANGGGPIKGKNALKALRKDYVKKKEEVHRLKAERLDAFKAKEEARSEALQVRKNFKAKMFKRTNSGQPLMKHRLQHILDSIQQRQ